MSYSRVTISILCQTRLVFINFQGQPLLTADMNLCNVTAYKLSIQYSCSFPLLLTTAVIDPYTHMQFVQSIS